MAFTTPQGRTATSLSEINVTPLVDVMLVLLIIFMVTAPMLQTGIDVELPETRSVKETSQEERMVVSIGRYELYYNSEAINFDKLPERLKRDAKGPKDFIFLRADKDVKWNSIVSVMDKIRSAGFTEIKIVTKPYVDSRQR
jgi:biopolymer transport protein ExbD/biopolymer transport protein TolR